MSLLSLRLSRRLACGVVSRWPPPRNCTALPHDCSRPNTTSFAERDVPALGNKFGYGLTIDPLGANSSSGPFADTLRWIDAHDSIGTVGLWCCTPTPDYMRLVGAWLHGSLGGSATRPATPALPDAAAPRKHAQKPTQ